MISALSKTIVCRMCDGRFVPEADRELYEYGMFMLLSRLLFLFVSILFGMILREIPESIGFGFFFTLIRSFAGGIHAKSESVCTITTTVLMFIGIYAIKLFEMYKPILLSLPLLVVASLLVLPLSPLDSLAKPLDAQEKHKYRLITYLVLFAMLVLILCSFLSGFIDLYFCILVAEVLESSLLTAAKIQQNITHHVLIRVVK